MKSSFTAVRGGLAGPQMPKRVIIVHGWASFPKDGWFPWLKENLEKRGVEVLVPKLPDPKNPRIQGWVEKIAETAGVPDEKTFFVGHSLGCQAIVRYLETLPEEVKIGGAVFVGGYFKRLTGLEEEIKEDIGVAETEKHWLGTSIDFEKAKSHLPKSVAIFSTNDYYVPPDNQDDLRNKLGSEIIVVEDMGHFSGVLDGITELPIALESVLKLAKI